jgi:hypothetical protein
VALPWVASRASGSPRWILHRPRAPVATPQGSRDQSTSPHPRRCRRGIELGERRAQGVEARGVGKPVFFGRFRPASGPAPRTALSARPRAAHVCARAGAYIFPGAGSHVLLRLHGEPVRIQAPDGPQARLHRGAAFAECGWSVRAAAEGVGQYGSADLGAKHSRATGVSSGEVRSAGFGSGLQNGRGDANRGMAATFDDGPPQARARSPGGPIHRWRTDGCN